MKLLKKDMPLSVVKNLLYMSGTAAIFLWGAAFGAVFTSFPSQVNEIFKLIKLVPETEEAESEMFMHRLCAMPFSSMLAILILSLVGLALYRGRGVRLFLYRSIMFIEHIIALTSGISYFLYFYETFEKNEAHTLAFWVIVMFFIVLIALTFMSIKTTYSKKIRGDEL